MKKQKLLALLSFFVSIAVSIFNAGITGAAIGISSSYVSLAAMIFFIFGLILTFYDSRSGKERIYEIIQNYQAGEISPVETVREINEVSPIQLVKFKSGLQHTIAGERDSYPIPLKKGKEAEELAILEYIVAVKNHPEQRRKNELHLAKGLSTKHYSEGIQRLIESIKGKYAKDLQAKLGIV